jgi:hypothetical protein
MLPETSYGLFILILVWVNEVFKKFLRPMSHELLQDVFRRIDVMKMAPLSNPMVDCIALPPEPPDTIIGYLECDDKPYESIVRTSGNYEGMMRRYSYAKKSICIVKYTNYTTMIFM